MSAISSIRPKYVVDAKGRRTAVQIDIEEFKALLSALEDMEDARELERAIADGDSTVPWDEAERLLDEDRAA